MWIVQLSHDDGRDLAAVVGLFAVAGAAVGEESRFVLIGAGEGVVACLQTEGCEAGQDVGRQVETSAVATVGDMEKASIIRVDFGR